MGYNRCKLFIRISLKCNCYSLPAFMVNWQEWWRRVRGISTLLAILVVKVTCSSSKLLGLSWMARNNY